MSAPLSSLVHSGCLADSGPASEHGPMARCTQRRLALEEGVGLRPGARCSCFRNENEAFHCFVVNQSTVMCGIVPQSRETTTGGPASSAT
eukprot:3726123-Rhodomonas_salina.1